MGQFCQNWFVEYGASASGDTGPVKAHPKSQGVRLHIRSAQSWVRLWQPIALTDIESGRRAMVRLRAGAASDAETGLDLEWIALLKTNAQGKRIFAKKLSTKQCSIQGAAKDYELETALSDLAPGSPYFFAMQFSSGPGTVELESVDFTSRATLVVGRRTAALQAAPAPVLRPEVTLLEVARPEGAPLAAAPSDTVRAPAPTDQGPTLPITAESRADETQARSAAARNGAAVVEPVRAAGASARAKRPGGEVVAVRGDRLVGWAELPEADAEVLLFVDGRLIGSAVPGSSVATLPEDGAKLATHGFAITLPSPFLDGADHQVSLRAATGERLAGGTSSMTLADTRVAPAARALATVQPAIDAKSNLVPERPVMLPEPAPLAHDQAAKADGAVAGMRRIAVVSWDMAHNPVGRAFLLADMASRNSVVELVGPMFPMYGTTIWPPIAASTMTMHAYPAGSFAEFVAGARAIAERVKCDVVHAGKARFSSLFIGAMIKQANGCPMIVDVDDHELGFFPNREPASLDDLIAAITDDPHILDKPYGEIFTRYAEGLIAESDGVTVSNYALQERFGGVVVRHGRDEHVFDPALYDRQRVRAEFGYTDADRVILFLGTPRPHKGVFEIADALEELADDTLALCVIGTVTDKRTSSRFAKYKKARIGLHGDQPWARLAELVSIADAVFLLQDPTSAISGYQIPAKLTDAMALGVPVYATPVPPLRDLIAAGAITAVHDAAQLKDELRKISAQGIAPATKQRVRDYYLTELSYGVNAARLDLAFAAARTASKPVMRAFDALFAAIERVSGEPLPRFAKGWAGPAIWQNRKPDIVFLWKQNDSDIYGRRSDMMARYLLKSGAVNKVLHFDSPISATDLDKQAKHGAEATAHQGNLVYVNTIRRVLRQADTVNLLRRTFLFRGQVAPQRYLGTDLPTRDGYEDFIRSEMRAAQIGDSPVLWVCPVVFDYAMVKTAVNPGCIVADVIDDQRRFSSREPHRTRVQAAYDEILRDADVVLANCEPVREGFAAIRDDIRVIPNGAEVFDLSQSWAVPEDLAHLPRPILGYVGNLRDRVDLELIGKVADAFPGGSVVLIGSAHDRPDVLALDARPNIHLLGVKPYEDATRYIRAFDVAMVPHLRNELSESMNPLKLYVYFALNVPIVTTDVANIGDIGPYATIAADHDSFVAAITRVLAGKQKPPTPMQRRKVLGAVSWTARVDDVLDVLGLAQRTTS
jgi:glycosyltransferase involved in cell wall biosynthesis